MFNKKVSWHKKNKLLYKILTLTLLIIFALIINQRMIRDGLIFRSHDLKYHILWLQHFSQQISEGILYPRWLSGDNYGYGSPTFVFYPPLVYYIGTVIKSLGFDIQTTITILFFLATFLAGLSFYHYASDRWNRLASLVGALFYMSFPYIALNIYIRGALAEVWAIVWIPIGFWIVNQVLKSNKIQWKILLVTIAAAIALTHVPSLLIMTVFCFAYLLFLATRKFSKQIIGVAINILLGFGLVSFYLLPAIVEKSLVNINSMRLRGDNGYEYHLLSFGLAKIHPLVDKYIEPIFLHQMIVVILFLATLFVLGDRKKLIEKRIIFWLIYIVIIAFFCIYPSLPLWQLSETWQMVQFPWRLFGIMSFGIASLFSLTINHLQSYQVNAKKIILVAIIAIIIASNLAYSYKLSRRFPGYNNPGNIDLESKPISKKSERYQRIKISIENPYDNLLKGTKEYPPLLKDGTPSPPPQIGQPQFSIVQGEATVNVEKWDSYYRLLKVTAAADTTIRFRTYFYPAWHLYLNGKPIAINMAADGTILATTPPGTHLLELRYQKTTAFKIGLLLSFISLVSFYPINILLNTFNQRFKME